MNIVHERWRFTLRAGAHLCAVLIRSFYSRALHDTVCWGGASAVVRKGERDNSVIQNFRRKFPPKCSNSNLNSTAPAAATLSTLRRLAPVRRPLPLHLSPYPSRRSLTHTVCAGFPSTTFFLLPPAPPSALPPTLAPSPPTHLLFRFILSFPLFHLPPPHTHTIHVAGLSPHVLPPTLPLDPTCNPSPLILIISPPPPQPCFQPPPLTRL